jgi:succinate dehydrogenase / fumarate reductase flavoprotein subunit
VIFTKSLRDMFPIAKAILHGALARDESRGAHYKPEFEMPGIDASASPEERRRLANEWCDTFERRNDRFLKTTIAQFDEAGNPTLSFENVDTSLIPPRPRLYGLVGAEVIEEVWKERQAKHAGNGTPAKASPPAMATR